MLQVRDVTFGYGANATVSDINFEIGESERVALLGGNGAGKSTVLKLVAGLEKPWSGSIAANQQAIGLGAIRDTARQGVRLVPQGHPVFGSLTIREHLRLAQDVSNSAVEMRTKLSIDEACDIFPRLAERVNVRASSLSGGERAFLGLALALVAGCSLLLLDEPSAGLAPTAIADLFDFLADLGKRTGVTMLIVEQNAMAAIRVCDRAYVMKEGRIVLSGSPDELYANSEIVSAYLSF